MKEQFDFNNLPLVLNAKDVAKVLGLSKSSTYLLMQRNDFPSFKVGKKGLRVLRDRFIEWLKNESDINTKKEISEDE